MTRKEQKERAALIAEATDNLIASGEVIRTCVCGRVLLQLPPYLSDWSCPMHGVQKAELSDEKEVQ